MYKLFKELHPDIKFSRKEFCDLLRKINYQMIGTVIEGNPIQFPHGLGALMVAKVKRDYNIKRVDWKATHELPENIERKKRGEKMKPVYFTEPFYLRFFWRHFTRISLKNGIGYKLRINKDNRTRRQPKNRLVDYKKENEFALNHYPLIEFK